MPGLVVMALGTLECRSEFILFIGEFQWATHCRLVRIELRPTMLAALAVARKTVGLEAGSLMLESQVKARKMMALAAGSLMLESQVKARKMMAQAAGSRQVPLAMDWR
jgi:hypothetical protein